MAFFRHQAGAVFSLHAEVVPLIVNKVKPGAPCFDYTLAVDGATRTGSVKDQELKLEPLPAGRTATIKIQPRGSVDMGAGRGKQVEATVHGGVVGIVLDGRSRPLVIPEQNRQQLLNAWVKALDAYPA